MAQVEFKSNIDQVLKKIERLDTEVIKSMGKGMQLGMRKFESHIISSQMSGRPGLRRQSGNLASSWKVKTKKLDRDFKVSLENRTKYAKIHQTGGVIRPRGKFLVFENSDNETVFARKVTIPKRLHVYEEFKRTGLNMIKNMALRQVSIGIKRGNI